MHLERAAVLPAAVERARDHLAVDVPRVAIDDDLGEGCEHRRPELPAVLTRDESHLAAPSEDGERAAVVLALGRAEEGSVVRERIVALVDDLDAVAVAVDVDGVEREPLVVGPLEGDRVLVVGGRLEVEVRVERHRADARRVGALDRPRFLARAVVQRAADRHRPVHRVRTEGGVAARDHRVLQRVPRQLARAVHHAADAARRRARRVRRRRRDHVRRPRRRGWRVHVARAPARAVVDRRVRRPRAVLGVSDVADRRLALPWRPQPHVLPTSHTPFWQQHTEPREPPRLRPWPSSRKESRRPWYPVFLHDAPLLPPRRRPYVLPQTCLLPPRILPPRARRLTTGTSSPTIPVVQRAPGM